MSITNIVIQSQEYDEPWWNGSWRYRIKIHVNATDKTRTDWPVEYAVNFTRYLETMGIYGNFDENSTRVIEINSSGGILYEIPSQFDKNLGYDAQLNAEGIVAFTLNGTNNPNTIRYFYVYFDILEYGNKEYNNYTDPQNGMGWNWDGEILTVNNTFYEYKIDTFAQDNTSGLAQVLNLYSSTHAINPVGGGDRSRDLIQLANTSDEFGFDLKFNGTVMSGPSRITLRQAGEETYWSEIEKKTQQLRVVKEYTFYYNQDWLIIKTNVTNMNTMGSVTRNSTEAGFLVIDALGGYGASYYMNISYSDPYSWVIVGGILGNSIGIINRNETGTTNFHVENSTALNRVGIDLDSTELQPLEAITQTSFVVFNDTLGTTPIDEWLQDRKDVITSDINVTEYEPEKWVINIDPKTYNFTYNLTSVFNRNESMIITGNVTYDPWNLSFSMNASIDNGTVTGSDDIKVQLYDDGMNGDQTAGDGVFSGYYNFTNQSTVGEWNVTIITLDEGGSQLNMTNYTVTVTDELWVNVTIWNPTGLPDRMVNTTVLVKNYRQDTYLSGSNVTCYMGTTQIEDDNVTDNGNGNHTVWFIAPTEFGLYNLNCTATKDGNDGQNDQDFTVEAAKTNVTAVNDPDFFSAYNVTWLDNESFILSVDMTNVGNSTAYNSNITISVSSGIVPNRTFYDCGLVLISSVCRHEFNITILNNTAPDYYYVNTTINWRNYDASTDYNTTGTIINVTENPIMSVPDDVFVNPIAPGNESTIGNITIISIGNHPLSNVDFTAIGFGPEFNFEFTPSGISTVPVGQTHWVEANVTVDSATNPGIYQGQINVTTENNGYKLISVTIYVTGTNMSMTNNITEYTSNYVTMFKNESFVFKANASNTGNVTAFFFSINASVPSGWYVNKTNVSCGNLSRGENCLGEFLVTVPNLTAPGDYPVNTTAEWYDLDIGPRKNTTSINVSVVANVTLETDRNLIEALIEHEKYNYTLGNFTLTSTGNDKVVNITFNLTGNLTDFSLLFNTSSGINLSAGESSLSIINVTIPTGYDPGTYNGSINMTTNNTVPLELNISITVPVNGSWHTNETYCEGAQSPSSGQVCSVLVNNTGNVELTFNVTPGSNAYANNTNYTWLDSVNFTVPKQEEKILTVLYDVTGHEGEDFFAANYTINATQSYASPNKLNLSVMLNPFIEAEITIWTEYNVIPQGGDFAIGAEVNSKSGAQILYVTANVTRPNGTYDLRNLTMTAGSEFTISYWNTTFLTQNDYGGTWGNTTERGNYSVKIFVLDAVGVNATNNKTVVAYTILSVDSKTGKPVYKAGETGSIRYRTTDYANESVSGAVVNISIRDASNAVVQLSNDTFATNSQGKPDLYPVFTLPHDAVRGTYTLYSNTLYYDANADMNTSDSREYSFQVCDYRLAAEIDTNILWYPESDMTFLINFKDDGVPMDPDSFNLTVYVGPIPLGDIYLQLDQNSSQVVKLETGLYSITHNMGPDDPNDNYYAVLRASKGGCAYTYDTYVFRVSQGGPYDLRINLLEGEVPPGEFLDFDLIIENYGEVSQDVMLDIWVSDADDVVWFHKLDEPTFVAAASNRTIPLQAFIFTDQPEGDYWINARITYSQFQDPEWTNVTFKVTGEGEAPAPTAPGGAPPGGGGPGGPLTFLKISKYPEEIITEVNVAKYVNIEVTNIGSTNLTDVNFTISGIPSNWFSVEPRKTDMKQNETKIFTVRFLIPAGGRSGRHRINLIAQTNTSKDEKPIYLRIFTSKKELIEYEIARIKGKIEELTIRAERARNDGKDIREVLRILDEVRLEVNNAENLLIQENYDLAIEAVYNAWKLLEQAEELLEKAAPISFFEGIPVWIIIIILLLIGVVVGMVWFMRKTITNVSTVMRARTSDIGAIAKIAKGTAERENLQREKEKAQRVLSLLETQHRSGIISDDAYNSLKIRNEQKINELDRKIKETYSQQ